MCLRGSDEGVLIDFVWALSLKEDKALCAERARDWTEKFGPLGISCIHPLMRYTHDPDITQATN